MEAAFRARSRSHTRLARAARLVGTSSSATGTRGTAKSHPTPSVLQSVSCTAALRKEATSRAWGSFPRPAVLFAHSRQRVTRLRDRDLVERGVELAVAATVEPVAGTRL